jgi:HNH endonuclease
MAKRTCSVEGCDKPVHGRGWCGNHYQLWRKYGDPNKRQRIRNNGTPEERWWARIDKNGPIPERYPELGPCWLWTGHINVYGYGHFSAAMNHPVRAHRWGFERYVGPIPEGKEPDHLCGVRACVKVIPDEVGPAHFELVTHLENVRRGKATKWLEMICAADGCERNAVSNGFCKNDDKKRRRREKARIDGGSAPGLEGD